MRSIPNREDVGTLRFPGGSSVSQDCSLEICSTDRLSPRPDIVTMAKPLANGFPIGAIMVRDHVAEKISVGRYCVEYRHNGR